MKATEEGWGKRQIEAQNIWARRKKTESKWN